MPGQLRFDPCFGSWCGYWVRMRWSACFVFGHPNHCIEERYRTLSETDMLRTGINGCFGLPGKQPKIFFIARNRLQNDGSMLVSGIHPGSEEIEMTGLRRFWLMVLGTSAILTSAALAQSVEVVHPLKTDLSHSGSYSWRPVRPPADLTTYQRLKAAVDRDLQAKGWKLIPTGGDITLYAETSIVPAGRPNTLPNETAFGGESGYKISQTTAFKQRTITISVYPTEGRDVMWRSRAANIPSKDLNITLDQMDQFSDQMLAPFPAAGK
jgi:hypothetical protein